MIDQDSHSVSVTTTLQTITPLDPIKSSTATTQVGPEVIVASGDTQYPRKQLLINNLHDIVLNHDLNIPAIAILGSQSSGKSSLIDATSEGERGRTLKTRHGRLVTVSPRIKRRSVGRLRTIDEVEPFGDDMTDSDSLKDRVERAQFEIPASPSKYSWIN